MKKTIVSLGCVFVLSCSSQDNETAAPPFADYIEKMMTVPNGVDINRDGELSVQEVLTAPQSLKKLDLDGDGNLNGDEIGVYPDNLPLVRNHPITNVIDADGDVYISEAEIAKASEQLKLLDKNSNWVIEEKELKFGNPNAPVFNMLGLSKANWEHFRGYTDTIEGPMPPGKDDRVAEGYVLIHDAGDFFQGQESTDTYLMDVGGNRVHEWQHSGYSPEASVAYLLPNGQLLRTLSKHHWTKDKNYPVGSTSHIELVDWEGNQLWEFSMSVPKKYSFHHDVEYLPNGNILAVRYTAFTKEEAMAMGWDPAGSENAMKRIDKEGSGLVWMDAVLELKPHLEDGSTEIVWQWNSWEHLVQDKYPNKQNFGDTKDPSKIDVNYLDLDTDVPFNSGQFFHTNTVDYNPDLDMIVLSSATYGEIWFIDHSTTTEEAASSQGGKHGKGGDLIYRWGNDSAFGSGTRDDSILYWQHDIHWIEEGLPGAGNMLVFNNGHRRTLDDKYIKTTNKVYGLNDSYSDLLEIKMPMTDDGRFIPDREVEIVWSWQDKNKEDYYSPFMSGLQRLPNGNTIFCRAYDKYVTEVTSEGEKVLHFSLEGWGRLYRIYKYAPDYPGLGFARSD